MAQFGNLVEVLEYHTKVGDTFDTLALELYADEKMSSVIMGYNRDHLDVLIFGAGVTLWLPVFDSVVTSADMPPWRPS